MDSRTCRAWLSSWLIAAASLIGLIGSTSAQTLGATRDMNDLKTTGGLAWMRDTIWAQKRPMPLDVHFVVEKDLTRTDPPYSKGRILTLETAPGDPGVAFVAGDAIVTGSKGESWPIARAIFDATYAPTPGGRAGADGTFVKKPLPLPAVQIKQHFAA